MSEHVCNDTCRDAEAALNTPLSTRELNEVLSYTLIAVQDLTSLVQSLSARISALEATTAGNSADSLKRSQGKNFQVFGQYL